MNTTQSPATHTPFCLPLEVHETREGPSIRDSQGERIAEAYTERGAIAITRAVNSHAQLVAALTDIETTARNTANTFPNMPGRVDLLRIAMNARAALSAAKE